MAVARGEGGGHWSCTRRGLGRGARACVHLVCGVDGLARHEELAGLRAAARLVKRRQQAVAPVAQLAD
eukprot:5936237-Prymnesium_polylepis.1